MQFVEERLGELVRQISNLQYQYTWEIPEWKMKKTLKPSKGDEAIEKSIWESFLPVSIWGGHEEYYEFDTTVTIPDIMEGRKVEFYLTTGQEGKWDATNPQFSIYVDGVLRQGLDINHQSIVLSENASAGQSFHLYLKAFTGTQNFRLYLQTMLRTLDEEIKKYYYDLSVPLEVAKLLGKDDTTYLSIMKELNQSVNKLDLRKPYSKEFYDSLRKANQYLEEEFYQKNSKETEAYVCCVGHTHIDVAWLWTLAVTQDKAVRSFSTVVELMKQYPEYIFMSSQPQLYQYVKEKAPKVYEQIKKLVKEGRWEPEGGMFLEPDCNLISGESMVRQFLYGKRFFHKEFEIDNKILWLPDVFGYSAALPQIMDQCGIKYFMTTKISWNDTNKLPYDTFSWEGIDGTKILTHFITTRDYNSPDRNLKTSNEHTTDFSTNYNGYIIPSQVKGAWQRYQQKNLSNEVLVSYGYGDGGGGPTKEMLETQRRLERRIPGCPATKQTTAGSFFNNLEKQLMNQKIPVWSGELYLEYHRATYTSMARNKRYNRKSEFLLQNLEFLSVMAYRLIGVAYPKELLQNSWEVVMRNQFHDILPGSSIKSVYEDSKAEYETMLNSLDRYQEELLEDIVTRIAAPEDSFILFNPNGFAFSGLVLFNHQKDVDSKWIEEGISQGVLQPTYQGEMLLTVKNLPALGYQVWEEAHNTSEKPEMYVTENILENQWYRIHLNDKGQFASYYDKEAKRELLQDGECGNILMSYEDKPHNYDNWNLYEYYKEKQWEVDGLIDRKVIEKGPFRYGLQLTYHYMDSVIIETLYCYPEERRIDMAFDINWKESQIFLKLLFPVEINSREASFEIQYGNVKRSTTQNTSWDQARYEVCYHKWMDISETGYGISFLNDCKYGVSIEENVVGLSLIKSGIYPNPDADKEQHIFTYSIYPHMGDWRDAGVVKEAYKLNNPILVRLKNNERNSLPASYHFAMSSAENVMIEVIKEEEDGKGIILRLYEYFNARTKVTLTFSQEIKRIERCNMLEEVQECLDINKKVYTMVVKPYEIITLKLTL